MKPALRGISIRVKLAALTGSIVVLVVLGHSFHELVGEAVEIQEEIALETRLILVSLAGAVGSLWSDEQPPDLRPYAERFERRVELRSLALLSNDGELVTHHGVRPTPQEIRMVTRLRLRAVPRTLWGLGTEPLDLVIATPVVRGDAVRGHLLCALRTEEPALRLRELIGRSVFEALLWAALGAGLTLWATGRLTRPLSQLALDLLHLGRGTYVLPPEGQADGEIGVVQDRLVALSDMLKDERTQVSELQDRLKHQINVISAGLEARADELSAVLDSVRDAVLVVSEDGRVLRVNEPARQFFGEPVRQPFWENAERSEDLRHAMAQACATQSATQVHTNARATDDAPVRHLRIRVAPLQRDTRALVLVAEDLTASWQLTEHMMRSERLASLATLTAGIAHQLGNHLNAIRGYAALLNRGLRDADDRTREDLAAIAREVRAAGALLQRTQRLTRTRHAARLEFTLGELLEGVRDTVSLPAAQNAVEIVLDLPEEAITLAGDPELLSEAFLNLAMNAIQAMPGGGELRFRARKCRGRINVTVSDQGEGIPLEACRRIFDPFFTTKPAGEGTGLGLAIAEHIVELHDGKIDVSSEVGRGTTFEILLPLQREDGGSAVTPDGTAARRVEATS